MSEVHRYERTQKDMSAHISMCVAPVEGSKSEPVGLQSD
jgi:hypothetical protein